MHLVESSSAATPIMSRPASAVGISPGRPERLQPMADPNSPRSGAIPEASQHAAAAPAGGSPVMDPVAVIRSKRYIGALALAAILGIPVSVVAYGFLALVTAMQRFLFTELPNQVLGGPAPAWWPLPWLVLCGLLVALTIRYLPGNGGHSPAFGFQTGGGPATGRELPGIILAALATLGLGAVLGPEAPLHRDRRRAWGADRPPCQEGRATDGPDDHGVGWQFCGDQHTVRLPRARRVPDHGDRRRQRDDAESGGAARSAGLGHRGVGLRRFGQLDRPRHLFPRAYVRAARGATDFGRPGLGSWSWEWQPPCWGG